MEDFLSEHLSKKDHKVDRLVTKGKGEFTKQDLIDFVKNGEKFGYINGSVFLLFSKKDKEVLKSSVINELDEQGFTRIKDIVKKLRGKLPTKRPVTYYQNFLAETNFIGVEKEKDFLYKWPDPKKQAHIIEKIKELLKESIALKEKELLGRLNNFGFEIPTPSIIQKMVQRCSENSIVVNPPWIATPARSQIIKLSNQSPNGIPQKKLFGMVQGFKKNELRNILQQLVLENKVYVKNDLVFLGPPPPIKNQILQACQDRQKTEFKNLMDEVVGDLQEKKEVFEKLLSEKRIYSYKKGKKTIVCFGELPAVEKQVVQILEKFGGISWTNLKKRVVGYSDEELQEEVCSLHKSEKIYVHEKKIFLGRLNRVNSDDIDSIKNQIKKIENTIKEFKHSIKPKKDKIFGVIYPECNVIARHNKKLFSNVEKFCADYHQKDGGYQEDGGSFHDFVEDCWYKSKKIMERDNEDFSTIWEIRRMMNYPKNTFDKNLKRMEEEGYIYFVVNNDPTHAIPQQERENSLEDGRGVLFYLAWRKPYESSR